MRTNERFILVVAVLLFVAGLVYAWWPLAFLGLLLAAVCGWWLLALPLAFLLDSVFGTPVGFLHWIAFPFTFLILIVVVVRALSIRHLR